MPSDLRIRTFLRSTVAVTAGALIAVSLTGVQAPTAMAASDELTQPGEIETAGAIATVPGTGRLYPAAPPSMLDGPGIAYNPRPYLNPAGANNIDVRVYDISAGQKPNSSAPFWVGQGTAPVQLGKDLIDGRLYSWQWKARSDNTWSDPMNFNVSSSPAKGGSAQPLGPLSVNPLTGAAGLSWQSQSSPGAAFGITVGLQYAPQRASTTVQPSLGAPANWTISIGTGSPWAKAIASEASTVVSTANAVRSAAGAKAERVKSLAGTGSLPNSVQLIGWDGSAITFRLKAGGNYEQAFGYDSAPNSSTINSLIPTGTAGGWVLTDALGLNTTFVNGKVVKVENGKNTFVDLTWDGDRVASFTDGLGRTTTLRYGGGNCPSDGWGNGFTAAPAGMICGVDYPNSKNVNIGYVTVGNSAQIALIKEPSNSGTTYGYDSIGRIVSARSDLANTIATVDPSAKSVVTTYTYNDAGELMKAKGGFGTFGVDTPSITLSQVKNAATVRALITKNGKTARTLSYNAANRTPLSATDSRGLQTSQNIDQQGRLQQTRSVEGLLTKFDYEPMTNRQSKQSVAGLVTGNEYDTDANGDPWQGMQVSMFPNTTLTGNATKAWWKPAGAGGISWQWTEAPVASGPWSARASGLWVKPAGKYTVKVLAGGGSATAYIDGQQCTTNVACDVTLKSQAHDVFIEYINNDSKGAGFLRLQATEAGGNLKTVSGKEMRPNYGVITRTKNNDVFPGSSANPSSRVTVPEPWNGNPAKTVTSGGLAGTMTYEPDNPSAGNWGRPLTMSTAGGKVRSLQYWANDAVAAPPAPCSGDAAPQYGEVKSIVNVDGSTSSKWYAADGSIIASRQIGSDGLVETLCINMDTTAVQSYVGDTLMQTALTVTGIRDGHWVERSTVTHSNADQVSPGASVTAETVSDVYGNMLSYRDISGTSTTYVYNDDREQIGFTMKDAAGSVILNVRVKADDQGRESSVTVNGNEVASVAYQQSTGLADTITYPGDVKLQYRYDARKSPDKLTITGPHHASIVHSLTKNDVGRIMGSTINVDGPVTFNEARSYEYNNDNRLTRSVITTNGNDQRFRYAYGDADASCGGAYPYAARDALRSGGTINGVEYINCYNTKGQLVSTTNPTVTGDPAGKESVKLQYDNFGRVTNVEGTHPVALDWTFGTQVSNITEDEGRVSTTFDRFDSVILRKTVKTDQTSDTLTYAYAAPGSRAPSAFLNEQGKVTAYQYVLPGGGVVSVGAEKTTLTVNDLSGAAIAEWTLANDAATGLRTVQRFGSFGEPLAGAFVGRTTAMPYYRWGASSLSETLPGYSGVTLIGQRPYDPRLGIFLAPDPNPSYADNMYSYTSGDPVNISDSNGGEEDALSITTYALAGYSFISGFLGFGLLRSAIGQTSTKGWLLKLKSKTGTFLASTSILTGLGGIGTSIAMMATQNQPIWQGAASLVGSFIGMNTFPGCAYLLKYRTAKFYGKKVEGNYITSTYWALAKKVFGAGSKTSAEVKEARFSLLMGPEGGSVRGSGKSVASYEHYSGSSQHVSKPAAGKFQPDNQPMHISQQSKNSLFGPENYEQDLTSHASSIQFDNQADKTSMINPQFQDFIFQLLNK